MKRITVAEAQERLDELLDEGARGEDILITSGDGATYRLVVESVALAARPRVPDLHAGLIEVAPDFDDDLPEGFWDDDAEVPPA